MKDYDVILIGTGSGMNTVGAAMEQNPNLKVAVIDKDEPGGICLTRGCIPSKILLYPAELVRTIQSASQFGMEVDIKKVDFEKVMERMHSLVDRDIEEIRHSLITASNVDYYPVTAEFVAPYTLKAGTETLHSKKILLCTGSRPLIPPVKGLEKAGYLTSDTVLKLKKLPRSLGIIGGGYIAAEYGHFFSAMGSKVTIIGRNPRLLPDEEPDVSELSANELSKYMTVLTNTAVTEVGSSFSGRKSITGANRSTGERVTVEVDEILVAVGRSSNAGLLHPENAGIRTDSDGWITTNEYFETSQPGIWAFGDAVGRHLFKHVANFESQVVYYNAFLQKRVPMDYHAIPHAVFTYPEIAAVGMGEKEAVERFGKENVLLGLSKYEETAKGVAMGIQGCFVKVIAHRDNERILGAHIIGPQASVLIQELIDLMYTSEGNAAPIRRGMHIHPALSEVMERAVGALMPVELYYHIRQHEKEHGLS
jgi:mycothione reductase